MHRAGFGTFTSPDAVYSEDLEQALANFQRNFRIPATGQFGRGSHEALRRLLAVAPRGGYALTPAARTLIESDATSG
jgi:peptidoglycan hydrolase-like protein with peptidoglycan-binding domain